MLEERRGFFDLDESMWSYEILQEATNDHEFKLLDNGIEKWINIK